MPGCNIIAHPKNLTLNDCCPNIPENITDPAIYESCKTECESDAKKTCCYSKCLFKDFLNIDGIIDTDKYAAKILENNPRADSWTQLTKNVINTCISFMKNMTTTSSCSNFVSAGLHHCIKRGLLLQCPEPIKSSDCEALFDYANACTSFPLSLHGKGGKGKGGQNQGGKNNGMGQGGQNNGYPSGDQNNGYQSGGQNNGYPSGGQNGGF